MFVRFPIYGSIFGLDFYRLKKINIQDTISLLNTWFLRAWIINGLLYDIGTGPQQTLTIRKGVIFVTEYN
ncbi:MAG: hypothetical protein CR994_07630 [Maribacter sp.]|nr:MAG: hypothetical protein CR994_07630 [Maribacter sp.]